MTVVNRLMLVWEMLTPQNTPCCDQNSDYSGYHWKPCSCKFLWQIKIWHILSRSGSPQMAPEITQVPSQDTPHSHRAGEVEHGTALGTQPLLLGTIFLFKVCGMPEGQCHHFPAEWIHTKPLLSFSVLSHLSGSLTDSDTAWLFWTKMIFCVCVLFPLSVISTPLPSPLSWL